MRWRWWLAQNRAAGIGPPLAAQETAGLPLSCCSADTRDYLPHLRPRAVPRRTAFHAAPYGAVRRRKAPGTGISGPAAGISRNFTVH